MAEPREKLGSTSSQTSQSSTGTGRHSSTSSSASVPYKTLIAVDDGDQCECAFDKYVNVIHRPGHELILVHCPDKPNLPTFSWKKGAFPTEKIAKVMKEHNEKAEKVRDHYQLKMREHGIKYQWEVVDSDCDAIGHIILKMAAKNNVDLIVISSRGSNSFKRTILHNVSDYVIHNSTAPVLVCPVKAHTHDH